MLRLGRVTNVYPDQGHVKVVFEDTGNASVPLPVMTFNGEYSLPEVGSMVCVESFDNGSSKGVVLGTFYSDSNQPKASSGYRKDFTDKAYATAEGGAYELKSEAEATIDSGNITFKSDGGTITVAEIISRIEALEARL